MKAVVMAGGEGSRLRPLTIRRPKPMVPVVDKPVMAHILDLLKQHGITEVVVTLQYMADNIQEYFGDGSQSRHDHPLQHRRDAAGHGGQRQAGRGVAGRHLHGHQRRRADRLRPDRAPSRSTKRRARWPPWCSSAMPNPLEYGVVIIDDDGPDQAVPGEAELGRGLLRHGQHRHLCAGPADLRLLRGRQGLRLQHEPLPDDARQGRPDVRLRGRRLLVRHRQPARLHARHRRSARRPGERAAQRAARSRRASGPRTTWRSTRGAQLHRADLPRRRA